MERKFMGRATNLTEKERFLIHIDLSHGLKPSDIAKKLGRHRSCITREVKLNYEPAAKEYNHLIANKMAKERMSNSRKKNYKINNIPKDILDKLFTDYMGDQKQGVQEAVTTLRKDDGYKISYGSIYRHVIRDKFMNGKLSLYLPRKGKRYNKKSPVTRVTISDKISIDLRPDRILLLQEAGHYEVDTIFGKGQESFLLTIVDIATAYTIIIKLENKEARTTEEALIALFKNTTLPLKSITSDNGGEFACHKTIKRMFNIEWYFCHPYCSWERGLNENTNGLIRRHFPKGTDFNLKSDAKVRRVQNILNSRYRKRIGYNKPKDLLSEMLQQAA